MKPVVLDHTALAVLGKGRPELSKLVDDAAVKAGRIVLVPTLCLAAATAERPGTDEHAFLLPNIEFPELRYPGASVIGQLIAEGADWRMAHAVAVGRPSLSSPVAYR